MAAKLQQMVERILADKGCDDLRTLLTSSRHAGKSFETISMELHHLTGGLVTVTASTISAWCRALDPASEGAA